jgi:predicted DNA-binding transcriptional regulator YafY
VNIWFEGKRDTEVKLHVRAETAQYFKNKTYFPLQKIEKENKDGSLILICKIAKFAEIRPIILHWIPWIKVISPQSLCDEVKNAVQDYLTEITG